MAKAARDGDPLSHGGSITKGSSNIFINGKAAATVSSEVNCNSDGKQTINKGAATVFINGQPAARVKDMTSCGATITDGSPNVFIGDSGSPLGLNLDRAALYDLTTFAGLAAVLDVVPFGFAADCFDEAVCLSQARQSDILADLPFFIEAEHGRCFSGKLDAEGRLPRIGTDNLGSYDIFWGDDALAKG